MQDEKTSFRVKEITKYDYIPFAPENKRRAILDRSIKASSRALVVKGRGVITKRWHSSNESL